MAAAADHVWARVGFDVVAWYDGIWIKVWGLGITIVVGIDYDCCAEALRVGFWYFFFVEVSF